MTSSKSLFAWIAWSVVLAVLLLIQAIFGSEDGGFATTMIVSVGTSIYCLTILIRNHCCCDGASRENQIVVTNEEPGEECISSAAILNENEEICEEDHENVATEEETKEEYIDSPPIIVYGDDEEHDKVSRRLYFIDNLKTFLTFMVVTFHVTCSFGACDQFWVLIVGLYQNTFSTFGSILIMLNQGYFMSLFFFISAYFTPTSFEKKGRGDFSVDKAKRLWIPFFVMSTAIFPCIFLYCQWFTGSEIHFAFDPGHCWFLLWLMVLNVVYTHVHDDAIVSDTTMPIPFPTFRRRWFYGLFFCGFGMLLVLVILKLSIFATMPINIGSLVNDLFMFAMGVRAQQNGWLEQSLRDQLDISVGVLRLLVVVEGAAMCWFLLHRDDSRWFGFVGVIISGLYCVDMSLAMLEAFQTYLDVQTRLSKGLAEAAYTVYLIHPIVVAGFTSLWIYLYETLGYGDVDFAGNLYSSTPIGGWTLALGWFLVNLACHAVVWPLAWWIRRLPLLREIL
jgi:glucan biosynthesis protein C